MKMKMAEILQSHRHTQTKQRSISVRNSYHFLGGKLNFTYGFKIEIDTHTLILLDVYLLFMVAIFICCNIHLSYCLSLFIHYLVQIIEDINCTPQGRVHSTPVA